MFEYLMEFIITFFIAVGYAIIYEVPRDILIYAGITGATGGLVSTFFENFFELHTAVATLIASFIVGFVSQLFARRLKAPVIIFSIPGIIPIVPGGSAYNAMRSFVIGNSDQGFQLLISTFMSAGAIALGLALNSAFMQLLSKENPFRRGRRFLP